MSVKRSGVDDLSLALHAQLRNMFVGRDIVLVAHSLGGLVARRYVLDHIEEGDAFRVKRLLLYAVPNDGSELARLGGLFSPGNRQLRHCCKDGDFIRYLNDDWNRKQVMSRLPVRYVVAAGDRVVSPDSAGRSLGLDRVDLLAEKNHRSVVEPVNREDLSYLILRSFVLGEGR